MSLQLVIPRRVALQQSSPPLHQPTIIRKEKRKLEKEKPLNCKCANSKLSQQRGSPQMAVPKCVPADPAEPRFLCGGGRASAPDRGRAKTDFLSRGLRIPSPLCFLPKATFPVLSQYFRQRMVERHPSLRTRRFDIASLPVDIGLTNGDTQAFPIDGVPFQT